MGFSDLLSDAGLTLLDRWTTTRSYIIGYHPTQADVACYKALKLTPDPRKYPHAARWYRHIASYDGNFSALPGDSSRAYSEYGPDASQLTINPAKLSEKEAAPAAAKAADDDDVDLFGSDEEEDAEAERLKAERLEAYRQKKAAGKPKPAAKSIVTLDVKPWDDETDMAVLEAAVRAIEKDGLVWGGSKLVAVGYGIKKLQINIVVVDDKVSVDELQEDIQALQNFVQSTDVVAMQKL